MLIDRALSAPNRVSHVHHKSRELKNEFWEIEKMRGDWGG